MGMQLPTPLGMKGVVPFKKYKGKSVAMVLDLDPSYIVWMHNNTPVKVDDQVLADAMESSRSRVDDEDMEEAFSCFGG